MHRRRWLLASLLIAVGVASAAVIALPRDQATEGPWTEGTPTGVGVPLSPGEVISWGEVLPANHTEGPITILSVSALEPEGVAILGILGLDPGSTESVGAVYGYPPPGRETLPIVGATLAPASSDERRLQVVFGLTLAEGATSGSIAGIEVDYEAGGQRHSVSLPRSLRVEWQP